MQCGCIKSFFKTVRRYEIKQSGLYCHLSYQSVYLSKSIHKGHDYAKRIPSYDENNFKSVSAAETVFIWHSPLVPSDANISNQETSMGHSISTNSVVKISFVLKNPKIAESAYKVLG